jgi:hypothetical protein
LAKDDGMGVNETVADVFQIPTLGNHDWVFDTHPRYDSGTAI